MSSFLEYVKEINTEYKSGFITYVEAYNCFYRYIVRNLENLPREFPAELYIIAEKLHLGFSVHTFNGNRWLSFCCFIVANPLTNWSEFENEIVEWYAIIYYKFQKFIVTQPIEVYCTIYSMGPFSSGKELKIEPGTELICAEEVIYHNNYICLKPLKFYDFYQRYIYPVEILDLPITHSYSFSLEKEILLERCKELNTPVTFDEKLICARGDLQFYS